MAPICIRILTILGLSYHTTEAGHICETETDLLLSEGTSLQSSQPQGNKNAFDSIWNSTEFWIPGGSSNGPFYLQASFPDVKNVKAVSVKCDTKNNQNTVFILKYSLDTVNFRTIANNLTFKYINCDSLVTVRMDILAKNVKIIPPTRVGIKWRINGCSLGVDQPSQVFPGRQSTLTITNETQGYNISFGDLYAPRNTRQDHKCVFVSNGSALFNAEVNYVQDSNAINLTISTPTDTLTMSSNNPKTFSRITYLEFEPLAGELRISITDPEYSYSEIQRWFLIYVACSLWNRTDDSFTVSYGTPTPQTSIEPTTPKPSIGTTILRPYIEAKQKSSNLAEISVVPILLSGGVIVAVFICLRRKKRKEDKEKVLTPPAIGIDNKTYQRGSMTQETEDVYLEIPDPVSGPTKGGVSQCGEPTYSVVNKKSVKNSNNTPQSTTPTTEENQCNKDDQSQMYADKKGNSMGLSPIVDEGAASNKGPAEDTSVYDLAKEVKQPQQPGNNDYLLIREDNADINASGTISEKTVMVDNVVYRQSVYGESGEPTPSGTASDNVVMEDNDVYE